SRFSRATPILIFTALNAAVAQAANPVITPSVSNLLPNTPNQTIQLVVSGSDTIVSEIIRAQINDGLSGPTFVASGTNNGLDLVTSSFFGANQSGQANV